MPLGGAVRGDWCTHSPSSHLHTSAGVPGTFRAWDNEGLDHIIGQGNTPHHNEHNCPT